MLVFLNIVLIVVFIYFATRRPGRATLLSLFLSVGMTYLMTEQDDVAATSIAPMIFVGTFLTSLFVWRHEENGPPVDRKKAFIKTLLFISCVIGSSVLVGFFKVLGGVFVFLLVDYIVRFLASSRHNLKVTIFSTIGSAMRQNLPLPMALRAADDHGKAGYIMRKIADGLAQGYPLSEALRRGYPRCPSRALALITMAERVNQVPLAVKTIEQDLMKDNTRWRRIDPIHPFYPLVVLSIAASILCGLMVVVIPKYTEIFKDFDAKLPPATQMLLDFGDVVFFKYGWITVLVILFVLVGVGVSINLRFRPRRPENLQWWARCGDDFKWHLPPWRWFERQYSMVQTVALLRLCLQGGATVDQAIGNTLGLDVNHYFRQRLQNWHQRVLRGENIAAAAQQSDLGKTLAWAFDHQVQQGDTPDILEQLEVMYRYAYSYRIHLLRFTLWPLGLLGMALMVGFVVYAMFSPLVSLTNQMVNIIMP